MIKTFFAIALTLSATTLFAHAQTATPTQQPTATETPTRTRRTQTTSPPTTSTPTATPRPTTTTAPTATTSTSSDVATAPVRAAFDKLLDGIRASDINRVMNVYTDSPRLVVFNNNGTVTKDAKNYRSTREQIYAKAKNVSLEVRDVNVKMLGRDGAVVSCLWTQEQNYNGKTEGATGRMSVVFERIKGEWKAVHTHTSPDAPDPSRLLPSERTPPTDAPAVRTITKP